MRLTAKTARDPRKAAMMLAVHKTPGTGIFGSMARSRLNEEPADIPHDDMSPTRPDPAPAPITVRGGTDPLPLERTPKATLAEKLQDISTSLAAASAFWDGDFADGVAISAKGREAAANRAKLKAEQAQRARVIEAMRGEGYSDDQIALALTNAEAFGTNFNQRFGTRVVAPGSSVVTGGPAGQEAVFTQPNHYEQYAAALGQVQGTPGFNSAITDYVLKSNGPTALTNDKALDDHRTGNRLKVAGVQHRNRVTARQTPTYRDLNPPPARPRPRAAAPRESIVTVRTPAEAQKLKPGTRYKAPDGVIRVR